MLTIGQSVRMINRSMLPEHFKNNGKVIKLHEKDKRIGWVEFPEVQGKSTYVLNLHEVELEDDDE